MKKIAFVFVAAIAASAAISFSSCTGAKGSDSVCCDSDSIKAAAVADSIAAAEAAAAEVVDTLAAVATDSVAAPVAADSVAA